MHPSQPARQTTAPPSCWLEKDSDNTGAGQAPWASAPPPCAPGFFTCEMKAYNRSPLKPIHPHPDDSVRPLPLGMTSGGSDLWGSKGSYLYDGITSPDPCQPLLLRGPVSSYELSRKHSETSSSAIPVAWDFQ